MADYRDHYAALRATGADFVAISVDTPKVSGRLRADLQLRFTILSDADRKVVKEWDIYNPRERGGIAKPAVFIINSDRKVIFSSVDGIVRRVTPAEVIGVLQSSKADEKDHRHAYVPRPIDVGRALRNMFSKAR